MSERDFGVSSIGSPIGKVRITDPFGPHLERFRRALSVAEIMQAPSYASSLSLFRNVRSRVYIGTRFWSAWACWRTRPRSAGVTLLHENEKEIYGDVPARCVEILASVDSPTLRAAWDPANFVQCGVRRPFTQGYGQLRPYVEYVHVKDAVASSGHVVPSGEGDGQIPETLAALRDSGFVGFFSLEPHLDSSETYSRLKRSRSIPQGRRGVQRPAPEAGIEWR